MKTKNYQNKVLFKGIMYYNDIILFKGIMYYNDILFGNILKKN